MSSVSATTYTPCAVSGMGVPQRTTPAGWRPAAAKMSVRVEGTARGYAAARTGRPRRPYGLYELGKKSFARSTGRRVGWRRSDGPLSAAPQRLGVSRAARARSRANSGWRSRRVAGAAVRRGSGALCRTGQLSSARLGGATFVAIWPLRRSDDRGRMRTRRRTTTRSRPGRRTEYLSGGPSNRTVHRSPTR